MKNPFLAMALMAAVMREAFQEHAIRNFKGGPSRRQRRSGRQQERGIVSKAFRQYSRRYGAGVMALQQSHAQNAQVATLDEAASNRRAQRNPHGLDPIRDWALIRSMAG